MVCTWQAGGRAHISRSTKILQNMLHYGKFALFGEKPAQPDAEPGAESALESGAESAFDRLKAANPLPPPPPGGE